MVAVTLVAVVGPELTKHCIFTSPPPANKQIATTRCVLPTVTALSGGSQHKRVDLARQHRLGLHVLGSLSLVHGWTLC